MIASPRSSRVLLLSLILCLAVLGPLTAEVRLPAVIGDHMVVQQDKPVAVWGWAGPGEMVTVRLAGGTAEARADKDGRWRMALEPLKADNKPLELTVRGEKGPELVVQDILVGEVWLCSGQSNMECPLSSTLDTHPGGPAGRPSAHPPVPRPQADLGPAPGRCRRHMDALHAGDGRAVLGRRLLFRARAPSRGSTSPSA